MAPEEKLHLAEKLQSRLIACLRHLRNPGTSSAGIRQLATEIGIALSTRTIRRRLLKDFKLPARCPVKKKHMVTEKRRKLRYSFSHCYMNHSAD